MSAPTDDLISQVVEVCTVAPARAALALSKCQNSVEHAVNWIYENPEEPEAPPVLPAPTSNLHAPQSDCITQELESYSRRRPLAVRVLMGLVLVEAIEVPLDTIRTAFYVFHLAFDYLTAKQCHRIGGLSSWPVGMASIAGKLAVCMLNTQSVHLYDVMSGMSDTLYSGSPLVKPRCISALTEDTLLVSDVKQMHVMTLKGSILRTFEEEANGTAILDSQAMAVCVKTKLPHQGIKIMRWTDGVVVRSFGALREPCDIVVLRDDISSEFDRLIVSDFEDKSIHTFSLLGVCIRKLTNAGSVAGLAVLSRDVIAVSDVMNKVVFFSFSLFCF